MTDKERGIIIPGCIVQQAEDKVESRKPQLEARITAETGARMIVEDVVPHYWDALRALNEVEEKIVTSQLIAAKHRFAYTDDGVCVVRFDAQIPASPPEDDSDNWVPNGIGSGLQVLTLRKPERGMIWSTTGVLVSSMKDAIGVRCQGGDSYRRMMNILSEPWGDIEITENKVIPFAEVPRVLHACFTPDEIDQPGGIIQALIDQASN